MWGKVPETVKCPRGDCIYYDRSESEKPCSSCTCCRSANRMNCHFAYESQTTKGCAIVEVRTGDEGRMAVEEQAAALAADRIESRTGGTAEQS